MEIFVALLRAINVGGTGKLAMKDLKVLCEDAGFARVATYIQSGNVVFASRLAETQVKARLQKVLAAKVGKAVGVFLRSGAELDAVLKRNPFPKAPPNKVAVLFLDEAPPRNALAGLVIPGREEVKLAGREVFIHFPDGMGKSRLKVPFAATATARNLNTVARLAQMAREGARGSRE
jgi:uncharacterized protein (DUF1697 family)